MISKAADDPRKLLDVKIVISGLDNAGKSSFIIALRHKYDFYERVKKLKPTIKIDYSSFRFINYLISCWDMGGQSKYREIYVKNPIYFEETDYLYYIIDIQDELKIEKSIKYFHEILDIYRGLKYSNEVMICFNKYDPKYRKNEEFADRIDMVKKLILTENKDVKIKFFKTSIYDIASLSKALSYSLSKLLNLELINSKLKNYLKKFDSNYVILYTNSGLIISDYYTETMDTKEFDEIISSKISDDLKFFQRLADEDVGIDGRLTYVDNKMEYVKKFEVHINNKKNLFYLGISAPPNKLKAIKDEIESFYKDLELFFKE